MSDRRVGEADQPGQGPEVLPVRLEVEYAQGLSRPLVLAKWLLVVPPYAVLLVYGIVALAVGVLGLLARLLIGRYPEGLFGFVRGYMALFYRTMAYFPLLLTDRWNPTEGAILRFGADQAARSVRPPVDFQVDYPGRLSRMVLLVKLPGAILVWLLILGAYVAQVVVSLAAWSAILLTGTYPRRLFDFNVALFQWAARASAWSTGMRDDWSLLRTTIGVGASVGTATLALVGLVIAIIALQEATQARNFDEAQAAVEEFIAAARASDIETALAVTDHGASFDEDMDIVFCHVGLWEGFVSVRPITLESGRDQLLWGELAYESGSVGFVAELVEGDTGIRVHLLNLGVRPPEEPGVPRHMVSVDHQDSLIVARWIDQRVLRIDPATGVETIIAGNGTRGFSGDGGPATGASLNDPVGIAVDDEGNVFIADYGNNRVRRVDAATGVIATVAGDGEAGYSDDGRQATSASLSLKGIAVDGQGNLFIIDEGGSAEQPPRVRRVDADTGVITTVAGTAGLNLDQIAVDDEGTIFMVERAQFSRVLRLDAGSDAVTVVAGGARNRILGRISIALEDSGNLFILDRAGTIREVDLATSIMSIYGLWSPLEVGPRASPLQTAIDSQRHLFIAESGPYGRILRVNVTTGKIEAVETECVGPLVGG